MLTEVIMFPGLGAEYPGMVARFCEHYPEAVGSIERWSAATGLDLMSEAPEEPCQRQRHRQLQVHAMNLLWWSKEAYKHPQAAACGHSLGFYAALVAAGVIDEDLSVELVDRVFAMSWDAWADSDHEIAAITSRRTLDDPTWLLDEHSLETLCVNSDAQLVVYGTHEAIKGLCAELGEDLIRWNRLDSVIPFHSWTMRGVSAVLERMMHRGAWRFSDPKRPIWSHIRARRLPDARAAAAALAAQPRLPVLWRDTIVDLRRYGASRFVEVGPNRILSQIVRWIVPGRQVVWSDDLRFPRRAKA